MKKIIALFTIGLILSSATLQAQTENDNRLSYSIFNEYGFYLSPMTITKNNISSGGFGGVFGFTTTVVNNLVLDKNMHFGLGLGVEFDSQDDMSVPLFFNFRNYFKDSGDKFRPMVNAALGMRYSYSEHYYYYNYYSSSIYEDNIGVYATLGGGFKVRAFSFHAGYFFKSGANVYSMGLEVKVGLVF
ncbi:hypothetical protein LJC68_05970 [Bacteroidales bacterium OttesenSCG-928-B11]|nr:hypothetical protein [Bacteroidales bacterium OttesenSCG-928-E04]MDL2312405.1 hypothetical protein [Bacteroidales bacterium OttesenSCG-928-B11]MDL2326308.1 hypothetical protein [Bacteroidales bacterium OttesenSCG-928-A14]